jgi:hypothetical protein
MYMLAILCLTVAAGIALARLWPRTRPRRVALAGLVLAGLVVDGTISGMPLGFPPGELALDERKARVLVLPFEDGRQSVFAMYRSMSHHLPVVNGYAGYVPSSADVVEWGLRRRDPTILTELRRGHPLYVIVAATEQTDQWTAFVDSQAAQFMGVQSGGRVYLMPAAPFAREVRAGTAIATAAARVADGWIVADLQQPRAVRGIEIRTHGNLVRLPKDLHVDTSIDGAAWQTVFDERPGGLALVGALAQPRVIPLRLDLGDVMARYVRVNTPAFGAGAVTVYGE